MTRQEAIDNATKAMQAAPWEWQFDRSEADKLREAEDWMRLAELLPE